MYFFYYIHGVSSSTALTTSVMLVFVLQWAVTQFLNSRQDVCINVKLCAEFCINTKCDRKCWCYSEPKVSPFTIQYVQVETLTP